MKVFHHEQLTLFGVMDEHGPSNKAHAYGEHLLKETKMTQY